MWLDDGVVSSLALDDKNRLWAGTHRFGNGTVPPLAGVKLLEGDTWWTLTPSNTNLVSNEITALVARDKEMWVGTRTLGVSVYLDEVVPTPTPLPTRTATKIVTASPTAREETPTSPPGTPPSATATRGSAGPTVTGTSTTTGTSGVCPPRCDLAFLPIVLQSNPRPPQPRTATPFPSRTPTPRPATVTPTPTNTLSPSPTATPPPATATWTPSATATGGGNTATSTASATSGAASPTATGVPTQPLVREWTVYDGSAGAIQNVDLYGVYGVDPEHVWLVGDNGRVYFWDGQQFFSQTVPPQAEGKALRSVQFVSESTGFIAGDGGVLLSTRNAGVNWRSISTTWTSP